MTVWDQCVLLVISDPALKQQLLSELVVRRPGPQGDTPRGRYQISIAASLEEAGHQVARTKLRDRAARGAAPAVVVLDQSAIGPDEAAFHQQWPRLRELAEMAPVILLMNAGAMGSTNGLASLMAAGRLELVNRGAPREGAGVEPMFVPLVMALVERHASGKREAFAPDESLRQDFGEILRHEVNNPLTGILGNAELLLARRDKLSPTAVERLKTIADLAVRLRETVRRLSNAWEGQSSRPHEVEVK